MGWRWRLVCFASVGWLPRWQGTWTSPIRVTCRCRFTAPGCAGWSLCIYNPELDPARTDADRLISHVARVSPSLAR